MGYSSDICHDPQGKFVHVYWLIACIFLCVRVMSMSRCDAPVVSHGHWLAFPLLHADPSTAVKNKPHVFMCSTLPSTDLDVKGDLNPEPKPDHRLFSFCCDSSPLYWPISMLPVPLNHGRSECSAHVGYFSSHRPACIVPTISNQGC